MIQISTLELTNHHWVFHMKKIIWYNSFFKTTFLQSTSVTASVGTAFNITNFINCLSGFSFFYYEKCETATCFFQTICQIICLTNHSSKFLIGFKLIHQGKLCNTKVKLVTKPSLFLIGFKLIIEIICLTNHSSNFLIGFKLICKGNQVT